MFDFKQFHIDDTHCGMKLGTDSVLLGAWAQLPNDGKIEKGSQRIETGDILDMGAGCGVLSLMLAQRYPEARIIGVEIDPEACTNAKSNVERSPWADRITIYCADALDYMPNDPIGLIVANPPYFDSELQSPDPKRAQARHGNGLCVETVLKYASRWLAPWGTVALVMPATMLSDAIYQAEMAHLKLRRQCMVSPAEGKTYSLALVQFSRNDGTLEKQTLAIRNAHNEYTEEYKCLTKNFYLNF